MPEIGKVKFVQGERCSWSCSSPLVNYPSLNFRSPQGGEPVSRSGMHKRIEEPQRTNLELAILAHGVQQLCEGLRGVEV